MWVHICCASYYRSINYRSFKVAVVIYIHSKWGLATDQSIDYGAAL